MGRAKRNPSRPSPQVRHNDGFRCALPILRSTATPLQLDQRRTPAPQIIVGQVRAAPPAVDWVVPAEIFLVGDNGLAELGKRQTAAQVGWMSVPQIFAVERTQFLVEARHGRFGPERQPVEQIADFPFAEDACTADSPQMKTADWCS